MVSEGGRVVEEDCDGLLARSREGIRSDDRGHFGGAAQHDAHRLRHMLL